jgi:hypothetical protein
MPETLQPETRQDDEPAADADAPPGDRVSLRLTTFGIALLVAVAAGFGLGRLTGPAPTPAASTAAAGHAGHGVTPTGAAAPHDDTGAAPHVHNADGTVTTVAGAGGVQAGGLAVSANGLTLAPATTTFAVGRAQPFTFRILGADGKPVTTFAVLHDKQLHLIVARRDLSGYQHLHPTMTADGVWSIALTLPSAGSWRAFADFTAIDAAGQETPATLGVDLAAPGSYVPVVLGPPSRVAATGGYAVGYEGDARTGATQPLLVRVTGPGGALAALQPYLGAYGHLVVLREGDLGYVHVHPEPELVGGAVKFWLAAPGPGRYRMYFDFQVAGAVHTAAFTTTVS